MQWQNRGHARRRGNAVCPALSSGRGPAWCGGVLEIDTPAGCLCRGEHPKTASRAAAFAARYSAAGCWKVSTSCLWPTFRCHGALWPYPGWRCLFPAHPTWLGRSVLRRRISQGRSQGRYRHRPAGTGTENPIRKQADRGRAASHSEQTIETAFAFEGHSVEAHTRCLRARSGYGVHWLQRACAPADPSAWQARTRGAWEFHIAGAAMARLSRSHQDRARRVAGNICTTDARTFGCGWRRLLRFCQLPPGGWRRITLLLRIPAIATQLRDPWELRPGDALNKPGSRRRGWCFCALRLTARLRSWRRRLARERTRMSNIYPLASLLARGYQPVRFRALQQDASVASIAAPEKVKTKEDKRQSNSKSRQRR